MNSLSLHSQSAAPEILPATHTEEIKKDTQAPEPAILVPTSAALAQPVKPSKRKEEKKAPTQAESSDTDGDAPVAKQMLSFVMDDPDFESEESDTQKAAKVSLAICYATCLCWQ